MKIRDIFLWAGSTLALSLSSPAALAQIPSLAPGYNATVSPAFNPSVPTTADPTKTVDYTYIFVGDAAGSATCSYTGSHLLGYTYEYGVIGSTVVKDRAVAARAHYDASGFCGTVSVNTSTDTANRNGSTYDNATLFSDIFGELDYFAEPYASSAGSSSGAWGSMNVLIATCPNDSSYGPPSGWCDCGGTTYPYQLYAIGCSVYIEIEVHLNAGYGNSPPSLPSTASGSSSLTSELRKVTITKQDDDADESAADTATFRIARTGSTALAATVNFSKSGTGTAPPSGGYDYTVNGSTSVSSVTIPAGSSDVIVTINPINDGVTESAESVIFTLTSAPGYTVGSPSSASVTIRD